jgi:hypothetical protein
LTPEELSLSVPEVDEIWMPLPPGQPAVALLLAAAVDTVGIGVGVFGTT